MVGIILKFEPCFVWEVFPLSICLPRRCLFTVTKRAKNDSCNTNDTKPQLDLFHALKLHNIGAPFTSEELKSFTTTGLCFLQNRLKFVFLRCCQFTEHGTETYLKVIVFIIFTY